MDTSLNLVEIKNFLHDISMYLRSGLQSVEYQNAPRSPNGCNEVKCKELLNRCDLILRQFDVKNCEYEPNSDTGAVTDSTECSYLDMSARNKDAVTSEYMDFCAPQNKEDHQIIPCTEELKDEDDDKAVYEICNVSLQTSKALDDTDTANCPYVGLPATHLSIQKSPKYGQLLRVEKRLFFGQTKKYYCGIMHDWLLCYGDGITSIRPTFCVHLNSVEVEHYGEGKRRDLCFQITDYETGKKIIFQATTEVDTKEWIHAIEAAIRGDFDPLPVESPTKAVRTSSTRKLPTPPLEMNHTYTGKEIFNDSIYEEPCPLYSDFHSPCSSTDLVITENESLKPPDIPAKTGIKPKKSHPIQVKPDYDVPKLPQPTISPLPALNETPDAQQPTESRVCRSKVEFQTKVKDVHSKLSNQLSSPCSSKATPTKKSPSSNDTKRNTKGQQQLQHLFRDKEKLTVTSSQSSLPATIKNGFWNRLNKTPPQTLIKTAPAEKEKENLLSTEGSNTFTGLKPLKGGKVNMIINQLEANGHLPIFTRNFERLSSAFVDSGEDCSYEPIMASASGKF